MLRCRQGGHSSGLTSMQGERNIHSGSLEQHERRRNTNTACTGKRPPRSAIENIRTDWTSTCRQQSGKWSFLNSTDSTGNIYRNTVTRLKHVRLKSTVLCQQRDAAVGLLALKSKRGEPLYGLDGLPARRCSTERMFQLQNCYYTLPLSAT